MDQQEYFESIIDHKLLNDIKKSMKCTKYAMQYSTELRVIIYILRTNHLLSYRKIMEYCQDKYDLSPSIGHVKQLIQDGEKALNAKVEIHKESPDERPFSLNTEEDISKNIKTETIIQNSNSISEKDKILKRKNELKLKKKNNDITISELRELWDLIYPDPNVEDYYMDLLKRENYINKNKTLQYIL